jgi:hypothetical protein
MYAGYPSFEIKIRITCSTQQGDPRMPARKGNFLLVEDGHLTTNFRKFLVPMPEQEGTITVGRGNGNDVPMHDPKISQQHLRFSWDENGVWIEDLGSRNGTLVCEAKKSEQIRGTKKLLVTEQTEEDPMRYPTISLGSSLLIIMVDPEGDHPLFSEL